MDLEDLTCFERTRRPNQMDFQRTKKWCIESSEVVNNSEASNFKRRPQPRLSLFERSIRGLGKPSTQLKQLWASNSQSCCGNIRRVESDGQRFQPQGKFFKGWQSHVIDIFNSESVELSIMQLSFGTFSYVTKFDICFTHLFD